MNGYDEFVGWPWRLLDDYFGDGAAPRRLNFSADLSAGRYPRVNVWESDEGLALEAELPGVDPKGVDVCVEGFELTLKGERPGMSKDDPGLRFERRFELPFAVDPAAVQARYRLGVLSLTLPKEPGARKRRIEVQAA
jgi:HSP20 family protein